jgi:hypothetical protein
MHFGFSFGIITSFGFGQNFGSKLNPKPKLFIYIIGKVRLGYDRLGQNMFNQKNPSHRRMNHLEENREKK